MKDKENVDESNDIDLKPIVIDGDEVFTPESLEDLYNLAQKGLTADIGNPIKITEDDKIITALKNEDISKDDINMFIDLKKGDKGAITALLQQHGLSAKDLVDTIQNEDGDNDLVIKKYEYIKNNYIPDTNSIRLRKIYNDVGDKVFDTVLNDFDEKSKVQILEHDPEALYNLKKDIDSGIYDKIKKQIKIYKNVGKINENADFLYSYVTVAKDLKDKKDKIKDSVKNTSKQVNQKSSKNDGDISLKRLKKMSDEDYLKYYNSKYKG